MAQDSNQLDVFKIFEDLKHKFVGTDPATQKNPKGLFVTLKEMQTPINKHDFHNPILLENIPTIPFPRESSANITDPDLRATHEKEQDNKEIDYIIRSKAARRLTNELVDPIIEINEQYKCAQGGAKISTAWGAITAGATSKAQNMILNAATQKALDDAVKILFTKKPDGTRGKSPQKQAYDVYMKAYRAAVRSLSVTYMGYLNGGPAMLEEWSNVGGSFQADVDDALNDWIAFGFKNEIEGALHVQNSQGVDPSAYLIDFSKKNFDSFHFADDEKHQVAFTEILPSNWYDPDNLDGWEVYIKTHTFSEEHNSSNSSHEEVNAHYWFYASAHYSDDRKETLHQVNSDTLTVSCAYMSADINRLAVDTTLLLMNGWFLKGDYDKNCISDGTTNQTSLDTSRVHKELFLPCLPTQLILIRDLKITWGSSAENKKTFEHIKDMGGQASVWGFGGGAGVKTTDNSDDHSTTVNSEGLSMNGIALIGFICEINPPSPELNGKDFMDDASKVTDTPKVAIPA